MSSLGTSNGVLEIAKFAVYVTVPIGLMYFFANNTRNLQKFMGADIHTTSEEYMIELSNAWINQWKVACVNVVYPPEGPRPPSPEEVMEMARELARKRDNTR